MIEKTLSILFYLKKSKSANQKHYVYLRVTVDGKPKELSTKLTCGPNDWNSHKGIAYTTQKNRILNDFLSTLREKIYQAKTTIFEAGQPLTSVAIVNFLQGKSTLKITLLDIFREHISIVQKLVGNGYTRRTMMRYQTSYNHLKNFISAAFQINDIELERVNYGFISDFYDWLRTEKKCSHNTTVKYLSNLKLILTSAVNKGWLRKNPFSEFRTTSRTKPVHPLNAWELKSLEEAKIKNISQDRIRDIFIFCCYTGLAYIDVKALTIADIISDGNGVKWLSTSRKKNGNAVRIPLLPKALAILKKYASSGAQLTDAALPVLSNQKMNNYLKKLAVEFSINKRLTVHIARHTFATTVTLNNNVPLETVSKMLGHSSIKHTQHYAKIVESKIASDMEELKNRLEKEAKRSHS